MKEWFLLFALHAIWRRRKALYYAVSVISIAGNFIVLVGPSVQTLILSSQSCALPAAASTIGLLQTSLQAAPAYIGSLQAASSIGVLQATIGLLQTSLQAAPAYIGSFQAASSIGVLQAHARNTLPQVAELVLQRSVLYIVLNLIVVSIVVKSGLLSAGKTSVAAFASMKQDDVRLVNNSQVLGGLHWLAPSYLHTVCSTISNFADMSTNPSMLFQHVQCVQVRGSVATTYAEASPPIRGQQYPNTPYLHDDQGWQAMPSQAAAPTTPSPAPAAPPSLFTIEPLDELVQSMKLHQAGKMDAQVSRHPLRKVATKVDLLQAVQARRGAESRPKVEKKHQQKAGGFVHGQGRDNNAIRTKEQYVKPTKIHGNGEERFVHGVEDKHGVRRKEQYGQALMHGKGENGGEFEGESYGGDDDDSELSRQELNERASTYISKVKRNLTMQRKDSLNRLLGLY